MKKGINILSFEKGRSIETNMKLAKDAGFDGIELAVIGEGELCLASTDEEIIEIRKKADETGLELMSLASGLYWRFPFTHDDAAIRGKATEIVKTQLRVASILSADTILVIPGAVGVDFIPGFEHVPYDIAYERSLSAFRELGAAAERYRINIGLENVWNQFLLSPLEFRDFIDKIGSAYIGCYFDVGNALPTGYPQDWIRILGSRIKKVHFKDFRKNVGTLDGFVDLLAGDADYREVMAALRDIGYDDYVTAEMLPPYKQYTDQIIYNTAASMDRIIKGV